MRHIIQAACGCNTGKVRKNNEDNFLFDGRCLEMENDGLKLPYSIKTGLKNGIAMAIFDGMGGENFGEQASFAAARRMQQMKRSLSDYLIPEETYLERMVMQLNEAVLEEQRKMCTMHMGTTMVGLYFSGNHVHVCNVGDSRAYRLRNGELLQLSEDHLEKLPDRTARKAPLSQHLGLDPEEFLIEPHIVKDKLERGDMYLLCSDGLTDMLTDNEISDIMLNDKVATSCVRELINSALEHGGRDNITVILCNVH